MINPVKFETSFSCLSVKFKMPFFCLSVKFESCREGQLVSSIELGEYQQYGC